MLMPQGLHLRTGQEQVAWRSGSSGSLCEVYWIWDPRWKVRLL